MILIMRIFPKLRLGSQTHNLDITLVNKFQPDPKPFIKILSTSPSSLHILCFCIMWVWGLKFNPKPKRGIYQP